MAPKSSKQTVQAYLEGKGFKVNEGWTATKAVLNQVAAEHPEATHPGLLTAKKVSVESVGIARVHILDRARYEVAEPLPLEAPAGAPKIAGILVPAGSAYILIDGYRRLKHLNQRGAITSTYLILY